MKGLITFIFCVIIINVLYTQTQEKPPIIFEGVVLESREFFIDSNGNANTNTSGEYGLQSVYTTNTSYLVKVTRVLKGKEMLDTGYVEVITKLSFDHIRNQGKYENYLIKLYPGIFFTEPNTVATTLNRKTNNKIVVQPYKFKPMKIDFNRRNNYAIQQENHLRFKTKEDLSKYLKEQHNIDYIKKEVKNKKQSAKKKSILSNGGLEKTEINYNKNLNNYNKFIENTKLKNKYKNPNLAKSSYNLHIELANETLTDSANVRFFEFDIMASDNGNKYFDNCLIRLSYNTNAFGNNLVANGNVKITKGNNFNSNTICYLNLL